jgi:hypothetical protein
MVALLLGIAALIGFLVGSRIGRHRWQADLLRTEALVLTQVLPYLARRAADLGLRTVPLPPETGSAGFQAATLCAMLAAREQAQGRPAPEDLADTLRDRK